MDPREGAAACSRARQRGFVIRRIGLRRFVPPRRGATSVPLRRGGHASASARTAGSDRAEDAGPPSPSPQHDQQDRHDHRIVTSTYRYKRPPRKRKVVPLEGPAIVRKGAAKPEIATGASQR